MSDLFRSFRPHMSRVSFPKLLSTNRSKHSLFRVLAPNHRFLHLCTYCSYLSGWVEPGRTPHIENVTINTTPLVSHEPHHFLLRPTACKLHLLHREYVPNISGHPISGVQRGPNVRSHLQTGALSSWLPPIRAHLNRRNAVNEPLSTCAVRFVYIPQSFVALPSRVFSSPHKHHP